MLVIGVTGGVGTGKSTVCAMLAALGAEVIDTDGLVHQMILPDGPAYSPLVAAFGPDILRSDGRIDRRQLGQIAFSGPQGAARINAIIHPLVIAAIRQRIDELSQTPSPQPPALVLDVPLLFESGLDELCDVVWVVIADPEVRGRRVGERDGPAADEVLARETWQMLMADKVSRADAIVDNSGCREGTLAQVRRLWSACVA